MQFGTLWLAITLVLKLIDCKQDPDNTIAPLITTGKYISDISEVPYHVGIYNNIRDSYVFVQHCGGTIVSNKLIISAAICFYDRGRKDFHAAKHYKVGIGKIYRRLNTNRETGKVQKILVKEIRNLTAFRGSDDKYVGDIVILELTRSIEFNSGAMPVDLDSEIDDIDNSNVAKQGVVVGWGYCRSENGFSSQLKSIEIPVINRSDCNQTADISQYLADDKFCGGYAIDQSVCHGDEGGGLVFKTKIRDGTMRNYLRGVVTHMDYQGKICDRDAFSLFTKIRMYLKQIKETVELFKTGRKQKQHSTNKSP